MADRFDWATATSRDGESDRWDRHRARILNWSARALAVPLAPQQIVQIGLDAAVEISRTSHAVVAYLGHPPSGGAGGPHGDGPHGDGRPPASSGPPLVAATGPDVSSEVFSGGLDEPAVARLIDRFEGPTARVPIVWDRRVLGVIAVGMHADEPRLMLESQLLVLGEQLAVALRLAELARSQPRRSGPLPADVPAVEVDGRLRTNDLVGDKSGDRSGDPTRRQRRSTDNPQMLLSSVAHDLRSPLAVIDMYAQYIEMTAGESVKESVDRMRLACRHLDAIIGNLLDFGRLDSSKKGVTLTTEDPAIVAIEAIELSRSNRLSDREVPVHRQTRRAALFDPNLLRQVLVNLVTNALKFTAVGDAVDVTIREDVTAGQPDRIAIDVRDTGVGIEREALAHIFTPYYRTASADAFQGLGLGLAISHALIDRMGGLLRVQSVEGEGSTFTVLLPAG